MWATIKRGIIQHQDGAGFTLIELLIVIAIIAILSATVMLTSVQTNLKRARDGKRATDLEAVRSALEIYRSENGGYPNATGSVASTLGVLLPNFISALPVDPSNPTRNYYYAGANCAPPVLCKTYKLCAAFEKTAGSGSGTCTTSANLCGVTCNYRTQNP